MSEQAKQESYMGFPIHNQPTLPVAAAGVGLPSTLLERAIMGNASMEVIGKLMDYQDRWDATQARKAFNMAFAKAKAKFPPVRKNRRVGFTSKRTGDSTDYAYETLAEIGRAVGPVLADQGLSYRWVSTNTEKSITVTCILAHELGHTEENTLTGPLDVSGNKNALQAIGSAQTYFQRYTLKAALGVASEEDDDARATSRKDEDKPRPPSSRPGEGPTPQRIRSTNADPIAWAEEYKKALADAKSKKELAQWAAENAVALDHLRNLEKSDEPEMRACAYLVEEVDAFYRERLDILDGKEPKAAPPPHDPETGEIIEPEPPSGSAPAQSRARPPSSKPDGVQQIMGLQDAHAVFSWMKAHPVMTREEVAAMEQRKRELKLD